MFAKSSLVVAAIAGLSSAAAQVALPSSIFGLTISPPCQAALLEVLSNGSFSTCTHALDLLPILTTNESIVPVLDQFMSDVCYTAPCTNATLQAAQATIISGCSSDLTNESLSDSVVSTAFSAYPFVREILCLKTSDPYTNASYGGVLGNPPIPETAFNSTGGIFCVTSLLEQLSAYFGTNLTLPFIESVAMMTNTTAFGLVKAISPTILCNDCIFAAVDLVEEVYPTIGSVDVTAAYSALNLTAPSNMNNVTLNGALNGTCSYIPLAVTMNGTIPSNTTVFILNTTFPYNVTSGNMTFTGMPSMKKRWFGRV